MKLEFKEYIPIGNEPDEQLIESVVKAAIEKMKGSEIGLLSFTVSDNTEIIVRKRHFGRYIVERLTLHSTAKVQM